MALGLGLGFGKNILLSSGFFSFSTGDPLPAGTTFTRASGATYYDGGNTITNTAAVNAIRNVANFGGTLNNTTLIEWTRTNECLRSEDISSATWTAQNVTKNSNAATAPDGNATADQFLETATSANHDIFQTITIVSTVAYTWSVYLKGTNRDWVIVNAYDGANNFCYFDVNNGVTGNVAAGCTSKIENQGNGWFRCSVTRVSASTTGSFEIYGTTANGAGSSYLGDITKGYFVWGMQLEQGGFTTSYIATVATSVTRAADFLTFPQSVATQDLKQTEVFWDESSQTFVTQDKPIAVGGLYPIQPDFYRGYRSINVLAASAPVMSAAFVSTDGNGVSTYNATSAYNVNTGPATTILRILIPSAPAAVPRRFLYVLPVKPEGDFTFGDGLNELRVLGAQNSLNAVLIAPSFPTEPWMGDNAGDPNRRYQSFMADLCRWARVNLSTTGTEEHWLVSFSKGGYSVNTLAFKFPSLFAQSCAWDSPSEITWAGLIAATFDAQFAYGTQIAWENQWKIPTLQAQWSQGQFTNRSRFWLSGDTSVYTADTAAQTARLQGLGVRHFWNAGTVRAHNWTSGWLPNAVLALQNIYAGRTQSQGDNPALGKIPDTSVSLGQSLVIALTFEQAQGSHQWNKGSGVIGTPLLPSTMVATDGPSGPILTQPSGNGINWGTGYTGADTGDRTFWFRLSTDSIAAIQALLQKENGVVAQGWAPLLLVTGHPELKLTNDIIDTGTVLAINTYYDIAMVWTSGVPSCDFYVNGVLSSTVPSPGAVSAGDATAQMWLGSARNATLFPFVGKWSQVRLYTKKLTGPELLTLHNTPSSGFTT